MIESTSPLNRKQEGFPKFPVDSLVDSDKFGEVIEILDWIVDEIQTADGPTVRVCSLRI